MSSDPQITYWEREEDENSKKGLIGSICFHSVLLMIFFLPWFSSLDPPPGPQGVLVSLGNPDFNAEQAPAPKKSNEAVAYENEEDAKPDESKEPIEPAKPVETPEPEKVKPVKPVKVPAAPPKETQPAKEVPAKFIKTVEQTQEVSPVQLKEAKEKQQAEKRELDRKAKEAAQKAATEKEAKKLAEKKAAETAAAEARKAAEAEAKAKAEAQRKRAEAEALRKREEAQKKQEAYAKTKNELGSLFGGDGESNTSEGKKGEEDGAANSKVLEGLSGGLGEVGGGLSGRGIIYKPVIQENSQKTGKVVVKVCVDESGEVISAKFTQRGSTTTDSQLIEVTEKAAVKYKFTKGDLAEQCGTITIDFKLK